MTNSSPLHPHRSMVLAIGLVVSILLSIFGLWTSLQYSLLNWGTDADVADTVMLWSGTRQYGLHFLATWYYTQDNWLLSLVPLSFAQFAVVGVKPFFVLASGWAIFVGCVSLTVLIAWRLTNIITCFALLPFLLLANNGVVGWPDFFTYPETHNISLFWGLTTLLLARRWIEVGWWPLLPLVSLVLVINGVSDPWALPAFLIPIGLGALLIVLLKVETAARVRAAVLLVATSMAGLLSITQLAGLLYFLPNQHFQLASWSDMNVKSVAIVEALTAMFSPFPFLHGNWAILEMITGLCLIIMLFISLTELIYRLRQLDIGFLYTVVVIWLSLAGSSSAFILSDAASVEVPGRFLLNFYVFLPVLICAGLCLTRGKPHLLRVCTGAFALLVMLSAVSSAPSAWLRTSITVKDYGTVALSRFLVENGLHRGYGDYFGTQSSAVSWVSAGATLIRPVIFDSQTGEISPRYGQVSSLWYGPGDAASSPNTFVIIGPTSVVCQQVQRCINGLLSEFGTPVRTLLYKDMTVLVWDRPIALIEP